MTREDHEYRARELAALQGKEMRIVKPKYEWQPSIVDQISFFEKLKKDRLDAARDAKISRRLALALGYLDDDISESYESSFYREGLDEPTSISVRWNGFWRDFSFRDPEVIYAIATRYNLFPKKGGPDKWVSGVNSALSGTGSTPEEAIVTAVFLMKVIGLL